MSNPSPAWRDLYERIAPVLVVIALLSAVSAVGWSFQNSRANAQQDRQRIEDAETFLGCFDRFATALAGGLPPVREATAELNAAQAAAFAALQTALVKTTSGSIEPKDVQLVITRLDAVDKANAHLTEVRAENPYPEAPSEFCQIDLPK